jgi:N,N'-diacetyl-8-epilegionaminate cytidylyltransferase
MMKNYAFIFARGGSKGLKNKNIRMFNGKHLISYSINLAKQNKNIKKVFVSSDDKKIIKISKYYGAETILRPKSLSKDNSSELKAWKHAIEYLNRKEDSFDNFICLPCTSPLRKIKDINNALKTLKRKKDMVVGISKSHKNPRFNMVKKDNTKINLLMPGKIYSNRQSFEDVYNLTTIIYACHYSLVKKMKKNIWESNIKHILIPQHRAIDIDNKLDFDIAEYLYKKYI